MPIELNKDERQEAIASIERYFRENMDEPIGNLTAGALLNFFLEEVGPSIFNKAVAEVQERLQNRIMELDIEVHEDEFQYWCKFDQAKKAPLVFMHSTGPEVFMLGIHDLSLFIVSGLLLNMAPGPDTLLIMTRSASQGWRGGLAAAAGIGAGVFVHVFAAALGLSAILSTSATAFMLVKYLGAAYLLYVGVSMMCKKVTAPESAAPAEIPAVQSYRKIFGQGFLTNALNPKVALFFLAFVPQFISPDSPSKALAFIVLGCIFNFNSMIWCSFLAVSTAFASSRLKPNQALSTWLNRAIGGMFVALSVRLALARQG